MSVELAIVKRARELLTEPSAWLESEYAQTAEGARTFALSDDAVAWNVGGALLRATNDADASLMSYYRASFEVAAGHSDIASWPHIGVITHEEILELLDGAIKRLEGADVGRLDGLHSGDA